MTLVEIVRWSQVAGMLLAAGCSLWFLAHYLRYWDSSSPFARFIVSLNVTLVLIAGAFTVGRFFRQAMVIESAKAMLLLVLIAVMSWQLSLLSYARSQSHKSGHEEAPTPPPEGQDRG